MSDNSPDNPQLNLEEVVALDADALTDEHKTFLEENKSTLTDDQLAKFGLEKEINLDEIEPETRFPEKKETKPVAGEEEEESEVDPDDEKTIIRVVNKQMESLKDKFKEVDRLKDETEVDAFLRTPENKDYGKYRAVILKYMAHSAYKNIPIGHIAVIVAGKDLQKIGAQKEREAQKKANETKQPGSQVRKPTGEIDWSKASKEDFEKHKAKILGRQGV